MNKKTIFSYIAYAIIFAFVFVYATFLFQKIFIESSSEYVVGSTSAFMGAFFAFLFVRLGDTFNAFYQRQIKHYNALVKLELYLHNTMYLMEHNDFVANDYKSTFEEARNLKKIIINPHEFNLFPVAEELQLELFGKEVINMLLSFTFRLKSVNADLKSTIGFYSDLKQNCISRNDIGTYLENIKVIEQRSEVIKTYFSGLREEGIKLICETRVQLKRKPVMTSIVFAVMRMEYKPATDSELKKEKEKLLSEQATLKQEGQEKMHDLQEKIEKIRKAYEE
ncbi:hypothetical protein C4571_00030 [Candidatus Parcubacteria bacterium]|nr:MAG: hypothetical protein C4571_00030 [Candidatus Parcubacteria bacterium]